MSTKKGWRYEIHDIDARVEPSLVHKLKADGEGWIVPSNAAPFDYGLIILRNPLLPLRRFRCLKVRVVT